MPFYLVCVEACRPGDLNIIDAVRGRKLIVESVQVVRQSLEDCFIEMVSEPQGDMPKTPAAKKGGTG